MMQPGASQVVTFFPDMSSPRWLGSIGHVDQLVYSHALPGGPDQLSCQLQVPSEMRTDAMNPGRICQVHRGGQVVWDGKLMEPVYTGGQGWQISAVGTGNQGTDFDAIYTTWTSQNDAVNQAITRGLRWINPGGNSIPSSVWLGQQVDSGAQTITDLLNLFCTMGGLTWQVQVTPAGNVLSVFNLPPSTAVDRTLIAAGPVPRTLGGDVNKIFLRFQTAADKGNTPATFATTSVSTPASITQHQEMEAYVDLSSAGTQTSGAVQALGTNILNRYQRASFSGPFVVRYGELLTTGGQPVDLGTEQAGHVCQLVLADYGYGGEVVPGPVSFLVGGYEYDDMAQTASVTPFQSVDLSVSAMLSNAALRSPGAGDAFQERLWRRRARQRWLRKHTMPGGRIPPGGIHIPRG